MTRRKLTFFLAVTAIALQPDVAHTLPTKRESPDFQRLAREYAVDNSESDMNRYQKEIELERMLERQNSLEIPMRAEDDDFATGLSRTPTILFEGMGRHSNFDAREEDLYRRGYYRQDPVSKYRSPTDARKTIFESEEDVNKFRREALREELERENMREINFLELTENLREGDEMGTGNYVPVRAEELRDIIREEELRKKSIFREVDTLREQELLEEAIRREEMLQDSTLRQASTLRQVSNLREEDAESDPMLRFQIAKDAFIYSEEIRQNMLRQQALRQEMLRQEALRQEKVFQENPERQEATLRQESEILRQLITQEELRQENARNLEAAYREEAATRREDSEQEQLLLQKAHLQEKILEESELRQEEAFRQSDILRKKISKVLQQVCINCGPKIVSVSNSQNIQI